jgi:hypothetical protein
VKRDVGYFLYLSAALPGARRPSHRIGQVIPASKHYVAHFLLRTLKRDVGYFLYLSRPCPACAAHRIESAM